jgi:uncharacterized protein (DUF952 family)
MSRIYKVCGAAEWAAAQAAGVYKGSADDARDGFIHFSTAEQLTATLTRHFAGRDGLVLVAVDADRLGEAMKWEPSQGGALFPHLYGALPVTATLWVRPLPRDLSGRHIIPAEAKA